MPDPNNPGGDWQQVPHTPEAPIETPGTNPPPNSYPPVAGYPPPNYQQPPSPPPAVGLSTNTAAALSYLTFIAAVIFLVAEPYKRVAFIRFHAFQCLALTVVWVIVTVIMSILGSTLFLATPHGGFGTWALFALIYWIVRLILFVAWLIALIKASQGQWFKLPYIGDFALRQSQQL